MLASIWQGLKVWRKVSVGPIAFVFSFRRLVRVTKGMHLHSGGHAANAESRPGQGRADSDPTAHTEALPLLTRPRQAGLAVIVGVGPGFGYALARHLASEGFDLVLVSRAPGRLSALIHELGALGGQVTSMGGDATDELEVSSVFAKIAAVFGVPSLVVYSLQEYVPGNVIDVSVPAFESAWRHNCLGAFLVSRAAGKLMQPLGAGSILLIGSTSSLVGRAGHLNLAVGKFGQRALAQVLARELWPAGVHVAHLVIDADVREQEDDCRDHPQADPQHIARSVLAIHRQPKTAWTSELDLRPWNEQFWEHC